MEKKKITEQYAVDIISAMAERTIRRLCLVIVLLAIMFGTAMTLWMVERSEWEAIETSYEIDQDTDGGGDNYIVGGDFNGKAESEDQNEEVHP